MAAVADNLSTMADWTPTVEMDPSSTPRLPLHPWARVLSVISIAWVIRQDSRNRGFALYRGKGLGTAFLKHAQAELRSIACANEEGEMKSSELGSLTPRFWPQVPIDSSHEVKDFFLHRGMWQSLTKPSWWKRWFFLGFHKSPGTGARDLYKDIRSSITSPELLERVSKTNLKFSPWSPDLYEECMAKQRANNFVRLFSRMYPFMTADLYLELGKCVRGSRNLQSTWSSHGGLRPWN